MKKILILLLFSLGTMSAKAALFLINNTPCTIPVVVKAHDIAHTICGLQSNTILLPPGAVITLQDVTSLNTSPGWMGSALASTSGGTAAWGWDAVAFTFTMLSSQVGPPTGCASSYSFTAANACSGNPVTVNWVVIGANSLVEFN
ncbi:hypothetical protein [Taibaiella koreensis]|uniref:hypothetical protein n=1 Tax=Taibaiella koreensis TaxID=1268548 RepID=UPI000E59A0BC|nr:hypothetical protein [Taibaiella koreensis]